MGRASNAKQFRRVAGSQWLPLAPAVVENPLFDETRDGKCFKNNLYTVFVRHMTPDTMHLSIKRNDRQPCKDWRHFQRIKNEMAGPEWEGVELYPAESRLIDTANQYHIWCFRGHLPFGFNEGRVVTDEVKLGKAVQRPLEDHVEKTPKAEAEKRLKP